MRYAYSWDRDAPAWYRDMDAVFGPQQVGEFVGLLDDPTHAFIGVFNPNLLGLITLTLVSRHRYEVHLWAKRATPLPLLEEAGYQIREQLVATGARELFVWVAERNRQVLNLCLGLGLQPDGIQMIKGCYKNRVIVWHKLSYTPRQVMELAA